MDLIPALSRPDNLPSGPVVTVGDHSLDWEGLIGAAEALAAEIVGLPAVGVEATPSVATVVATCAALMAGTTLVPIPPDAGPLERDHILRDAGLEQVLGSTIPIDPGRRFSGRLARRPHPAGEAQAALVLYTSGTTGPPKGVMLSAEALALDLDLLAQAWAWTPEDTLVHGLPLFHVHGLVLGVLGPLRVGSPLVHTVRPTPASYASAGGTLYFGVPTVWSRVAADPQAARALRSARLLVSGSAGLPEPVFRALEASAGQGPLERYGMTETLIVCSGRHDLPRRPGWAGRALEGVAARLVDEEGQLLPHDGWAVGELEVLTPTAMLGYLNRPQETAALRNSEGWIHTGDALSIDEQGWWRIWGRKSLDLIKSGGYRIGAGEVESALLSHPAVVEAAVVGEPHPELGQVVVAFVVAPGASSHQLEEFVATNLSAHKRPRRVVLVDQLPRNSMGKVQKSLLLGL